jgi:CheY-like chemotaxis protein
MANTMEIGTRASVLLVEDEPMVSEVVANALAEQGFAVDTVANAHEALRRLRSGPPIDILFTDVVLPGDMDGAALARRARELQPHLPVIYTSGRRQVIDGLEPVEGAMFVPKPYDFLNLGRLVQYLVVARRAHDGMFA